MGVELNDFRMRTLGTTEDVPEGFVCFGSRWPAKGKRGRDRDRIKRGILSKHVSAARRVRFAGDDSGPVYVNERQAVAWLKTYESDGDQRAASRTRAANCHTAVDVDTLSKRLLDGLRVELLAPLVRRLDAIELAVMDGKTRPES